MRPGIRLRSPVTSRLRSATCCPTRCRSGPRKSPASSRRSGTEGVSATPTNGPAGGAPAPPNSTLVGGGGRAWAVFERLAGQEAVVEQLRTAAGSSRLAHAWLFTEVLFGGAGAPP